MNETLVAATRASEQKIAEIQPAVDIMQAKVSQVTAQLRVGYVSVT